jgi:hypothetical protein
MHPTRGWAPIALGLEYPFWLEGRRRWRPVLPLLRRYEQLRLWCASALLRIPGVSAVILGELTRLEVELLALHPPKLHTAVTTVSAPDAGRVASHEGDTREERTRY